MKVCDFPVLPFEHPWAVLFELRHVIGCCHAEPISAKLSRAKVKAAHESSELHPNFIYSFNMIFLPILLQRDIINLVNYDFKKDLW